MWKRSINACAEMCYLAFQILMELGDWREALAYCRLTITGYQSMPRVDWSSG